MCVSARAGVPIWRGSGKRRRSRLFPLPDGFLLSVFVCPDVEGEVFRLRGRYFVIVARYRAFYFLVAVSVAVSGAAAYGRARAGEYRLFKLRRDYCAARLYILFLHVVVFFWGVE